MAIAFVPVALGVGHLYPWANEAADRTSEVLAHRAAYMNTTMFVVRAVIYFVIWSTISTRLVAWSRAQDSSGYDSNLAGRISVLSHIGIPIWLLSMSLATVDWAMSIEGAWFSHI